MRLSLRNYGDERAEQSAFFVSVSRRERFTYDFEPCQIFNYIGFQHYIVEVVERIYEVQRSQNNYTRELFY